MAPAHDASSNRDRSAIAVLSRGTSYARSAQPMGCWRRSVTIVGSGLWVVPRPRAIHARMVHRWPVPPTMLTWWGIISTGMMSWRRTITRLVARMVPRRGIAPLRRVVATATLLRVVAAPTVLAQLLTCALLALAQVMHLLRALRLALEVLHVLTLTLDLRRARSTLRLRFTGQGQYGQQRNPDGSHHTTFLLSRVLSLSLALCTAHPKIRTLARFVPVVNTGTKRKQRASWRAFSLWVVVCLVALQRSVSRRCLLWPLLACLHPRLWQAPAPRRSRCRRCSPSGSGQHAPYVAHGRSGTASPTRRDRRR